MGAHPSTAVLTGATALASPGSWLLERVGERQGGHKAWWACRLQADGD